MIGTRRIALGAALGLLVACGGPQPGPSEPNPSVPQSTPEATATESVAPQGLTEAELAERAEARARDLFAEAAAVYDAAPRGQRDLSRVESLLEGALTEDASLTDAWFNIGVVRAESGNSAGAREAYERALSLDPEYARALANLGYLQMIEEDLQGALGTFERCVEVRETEPGCNINLSLLYQLGVRSADVSTEDVAAATIERLRFALGGDARNASAYANMAQVYFEAGRLELARLVCENAILLGIDQAVLHNRLGIIALALDEVNVAYQEFQRAVQLDPSLIEAHMNIGAMALSFRDYEAALRAFQVVLADRPDDIDVKLSYGVALRGMDDLEGATRVYGEVLDASSGHLGALYNSGVLQQEGLGDYAAACGFYREYLAQADAPGSEKFDDVSQRMSTLYDLYSSLVFLGEATEEQAQACAP